MRRRFHRRASIDRSYPGEHQVLADGKTLIIDGAFVEWGYVIAALIGSLGDFDLAARRSPRDPRAWLVSTAHNRAIDRIRRDRVLAAKTRVLETPEPAQDRMDATTFADERLELVFTCCHPAIATDAQVALTLRTPAA